MYGGRFSNGQNVAGIVLVAVDGVTSPKAMSPYISGVVVVQKWQW